MDQRPARIKIKVLIQRNPKYIRVRTMSLEEIDANYSHDGLLCFLSGWLQTRTQVNWTWKWKNWCFKELGPRAFKFLMRNYIRKRIFSCIGALYSSSLHQTHANSTIWFPAFENCRNHIQCPRASGARIYVISNLRMLGSKMEAVRTHCNSPREKNEQPMKIRYISRFS